MTRKDLDLSNRQGEWRGIGQPGQPWWLLAGGWGTGTAGSVIPDHPRSKRYRFITLSHAATKSHTRACCPSSHPYTSETARSSEFEPNTRSPAGKSIDRFSHYADQTNYTFVRCFCIWKSFLESINATMFDARKISI